jgi:hypothetical protein
MTTFCIVAGTSPLLTGMLEPSGPVARGELRPRRPAALARPVPVMPADAPPRRGSPVPSIQLLPRPGRGPVRRLVIEAAVKVSGAAPGGRSMWPGSTDGTSGSSGRQRWNIGAVAVLADPGLQGPAGRMGPTGRTWGRRAYLSGRQAGQHAAVADAKHLVLTTWPPTTTPPGYPTNPSVLNARPGVRTVRR